jgi:molybdopterin molybdotransferase
LRCIGVLAAGQVPDSPIDKGECLQIMTGCMLPEGADCVLMVEHTETLANGNIRYLKETTATNICLTGEDIRRGEMVLEKGTILRPQHIAVLAAVGCVNPKVYSKPLVGVISTGDELVEPDEIPGPAKIRNSNAAQLMAQLGDKGFDARYFGIAPDEPEKTLEIIEKALSQCHLILLTGGVSMGEFDFVPEMMQRAGLEILFKSIAVQPGRPTVFGKSSNGKYCFGLPGNPVSSFVQMHLLVFPLMYALMGSSHATLNARLPLTHDFHRKKAERLGLVPVKVLPDGSLSRIDYNGSAHINAYVAAQGVLFFEPGVFEIRKGEMAYVRLI